MVQKQQHLAPQISQNLVTQTNSERLFWIIIDTQLNLREYLKNTVTKIKKTVGLKKILSKIHKSKNFLYTEGQNPVHVIVS